MLSENSQIEMIEQWQAPDGDYIAECTNCGAFVTNPCLEPVTAWAIAHECIESVEA